MLPFQFYVFPKRRFVVKVVCVFVVACLGVAGLHQLLSKPAPRPLKPPGVLAFVGDTEELRQAHIAAGDVIMVTGTVLRIEGRTKLWLDGVSVSSDEAFDRHILPGHRVMIISGTVKSVGKDVELIDAEIRLIPKHPETK